MSGAPATTHRFRLGPRLGQGAFGEVVRAFDRELGEWVAVKRSLGGAHDALASEHAALAAVSHPNVVRAGVWVEGPEWTGYSMALVEGPDAREWVRGAHVERSEDTPRRNLPMAFGQELQDVGDSRYRVLAPEGVQRLRRLVSDLTDALDAVHGAGLLHLDVNPENVRIAKGRAVLLDLGLAMEAGTTPADGAYLGSAAYGAPELGMRPPTTASDFYSLGVLTFELLLGDRPFEGGGPEVLVRKQSLEASRPSELAAVPEDLDAICVGLLQRLPSRRMDGAAIRAALDHIERPPVR